MGTSYETADNAQDVIHDLTPIVYSFCVRPHGVRRDNNESKHLAKLVPTRTN